MKYAGFWEFNLKDWEEAFKRNAEIGEARRKNPEDFPKIVLGAHFIGGSNKGLTIFETDDPNKLLKISVPFAPILTWKFEPLFPIEECYKVSQKK